MWQIRTTLQTEMYHACSDSAALLHAYCTALQNTPSGQVLHAFAAALLGLLPYGQNNATAGGALQQQQPLPRL